jgi:hypothetical protein
MDMIKIEPKKFSVLGYNNENFSHEDGSRANSRNVVYINCTTDNGKFQI